MTEKLKSVRTYIILVFMIGVLAYLIGSYGKSLRDSPHSNLSNSSYKYISELTGEGLEFNDSMYDDEIGRASELGGTENKNDFSLDFSFGDKTGNKIERVVYLATNIPEFLIMDVFRLVGDESQWLVDSLDWVLNIFLFIAVVSYIRGRD